MSAPSDHALAHGLDGPPDVGRLVHAGPVDALLVDGELRYLRVSGTEVARRIHVAVRDPAWNTPPAELSAVEVDQRANGFTVGYEAVNRSGDLVFRWRCAIEGSEDGTIAYEMDGEVERDCSYQRIGLCVLHPTDVFAGQRYEASSAAGMLPAGVAAQVLVGEIFEPVVPAFEWIRMVAETGVAVEFSFEGDVFEIEDQRNWTDASFKSYSRHPLTRIEPWDVAAGTRFRQRVVVRPRGGTSRGRSAAGPIEIELGDAIVGHVPEIGLALDAGGADHSDHAIGHLRRLDLAHLRVDVHLDDASWAQELDRGARIAGQLGCGLELGVFLTAADEPAVAALAERLAGAAPVRRLLAYEVGAEVTAPSLVALLRDACREALRGAPVGGGTDIYFADINRATGFGGEYQVLAYPVTPQVHADDDLSLVETPMAQADTVARARELGPASSIAITPITLKPRYNPDAQEATTAAGELPDNVDRRQVSLLAAAWTIASIRHLGVAGAGSATYYETVGWRGVIEVDQPAPERPPFPSVPGMLFPVYDALADLSPLRGREILASSSSDPLAVETLRVRLDDGELLLIANLRAAARGVRVGPLGTAPRIRRITVAAVRENLRGPRALDLAWEGLASSDGHATLELGPYEIAALRSGSAQPPA
jgi:hypothetical protein